MLIGRFEVDAAVLTLQRNHMKVVAVEERGGAFYARKNAVRNLGKNHNIS